MKNGLFKHIFGVIDGCGFVAAVVFRLSGAYSNGFYIHISGVLFLTGALLAFFPVFTFKLSMLRARRISDGCEDAEPSEEFYVKNKIAVVALSVIAIMLLIINVIKYFGG